VGQEVYVDCEGRVPHRAVEAVRRDIGALRAGPSTVVVRTDDEAIVEAVTAWAKTHGLVPTVEERPDRRFLLRFFVLPTRFGGLPDCTLRERRRSRGTRTPLYEPEVDRYAV